MTGPANLGSSSTNALGLANAFTDVNTLVNTATGFARGPAAPAGTVVPVARINTLADILASCVNSKGGAAPDTLGGMLFSAATPAGGKAPIDTITAAVNIVRHPGANAANLSALTGASAPFQPTLSTQPKDFTLAVTYAPAGLSTPSSLAVDSQGSVWVANAGANIVTKLLHTGAAGQTYTGNLNLPSAIAVDTTDGVWIANRGGNTISHLDSSGVSVVGSPFSGGGLNQPVSLALDNGGNVWVANFGNASISKIAADGTPISPASGFISRNACGTHGHRCQRSLALCLSQHKNVTSARDGSESRKSMRNEILR